MAEIPDKYDAAVESAIKIERMLITTGRLAYSCDTFQLNIRRVNDEGISSAQKSYMQTGNMVVIAGLVVLFMIGGTLAGNYGPPPLPGGNIGNGFFGEPVQFQLPGLGAVRGRRLLSGVQSPPTNYRRPFLAFRGIPYAKPPSGIYRFREPRPYGSWSGTLEATEYKRPCPQVDPVTGSHLGDEDCLYLNVAKTLALLLNPQAITQGFSSQGAHIHHLEDKMLQQALLELTEEFSRKTMYLQPMGKEGSSRFPCLNRKTVLRQEEATVQQTPKPGKVRFPRSASTQTISPLQKPTPSTQDILDVELLNVAGNDTDIARSYFAPEARAPPLQPQINAPGFYPNPIPKALLPVMVFIHGPGAFVAGAAQQFGPQPLMRHDVVLVTFDYRLGVLGFMSTNDRENPGNWGLLDQIEALRWVKQNIQAFGGDPNKVTVFGHQAGAAAAHLLMLSPRARGLFDQVILQSGAAICNWAIEDDPWDFARRIGVEVNCRDPWSSDDLMDCLEDAPVTRILDAQEKLRKYGYFQQFSAGPVVDRKFRDDPVLPDHPYRLVTHGQFNRIPMIIGTTQDEGMLQFLMTYLDAGEDARSSEHLRHRVLPRLVHYMTRHEHEVEPMIDAIYEQYFNLTNFGDQDQVMRAFTNMLTDGMFESCKQETLRLHARNGGDMQIYSYVASYWYRTLPLIREQGKRVWRGQAFEIVAWVFVGLFLLLLLVLVALLVTSCVRRRKQTYSHPLRKTTLSALGANPSAEPHQCQLFNLLYRRSAQETPVVEVDTDVAPIAPRDNLVPVLKRKENRTPTASFKM
ncbi:unnamed protein product [Notodromas monacha]|uniref:Carboxylesterase type B domain-containing protein n=1 Tax=Notodromas monacha TaxID=399045 RepID=A0A7R9GHA4_9CRUS|nr:unnamed protein product [Notodromas monacha]CAG0922670.1 unnamed protein product [Notodromas monacha]